MQIAEKLAKKAKDNRQEAPVTIAFYGDSVTQGCFELYKVGEAGHQTIFDRRVFIMRRLRRFCPFSILQCR